METSITHSWYLTGTATLVAVARFKQVETSSSWFDLVVVCVTK